jgi:hypothetical protein
MIMIMLLDHALEQSTQWRHHDSKNSHNFTRTFLRMLRKSASAISSFTSVNYSRLQERKSTVEKSNPGRLQLPSGVKFSMKKHEQGDTTLSEKLRALSEAYSIDIDDDAIDEDIVAEMKAKDEEFEDICNHHNKITQSTIVASITDADDITSPSPKGMSMNENAMTTEETINSDDVSVGTKSSESEHETSGFHALTSTQSSGWGIY